MTTGQRLRGTGIRNGLKALTSVKEETIKGVSDDYIDVFLQIIKN